MTDGGLDALFGSSEQAPVPAEVDEPVAKDRSQAVRVLRNVLTIAAVTVVTVAAIRSAGYRISAPLVVVFFIGLRVVLGAVFEVSPPAPPKRGPDAYAATGEVGTDSLRAAVRRWERNIEQAHADADIYSRNLLPVLAELIDERLRLRHGITRQSDPRRARELLGDPLWAVLHDSARRSARARELLTYVDALERL